MFVDALVLNVQQALSPKERAQQCTIVVMVRNDRGGKTAVQRIIAQPQPQSQPQPQQPRQQERQGRAHSTPCRRWSACGGTTARSLQRVA